MTNRVKVYRNLRNGKWSVLDSKGKLLFYVESIKIKNAKFIVQKAGNKRVKVEKQKNVHAFVVGEIDSINRNYHIRKYKKGNYCPYKYSFFVDENSNKLERADVVILTKKSKLYYSISSFDTVSPKIS